MVGDSTYDMEMARAAGVHAIGVSWGYHAPALLTQAGAHRIARDFAELDALLAAVLDAARAPLT
jgi:phosphoglycolate phosphatase